MTWISGNEGTQRDRISQNNSLLVVCVLFDDPSYLAEDRLTVESVEALVAPHPQGRATGVGSDSDYSMNSRWKLS